MRVTYLHQYFNTPAMPGGTRSYEMARRLVAAGHDVNMVTSWREKDGREDWFVTEEAGIKVHWLPVPYSNQMSYGERIQAFFRFAWGAARRAASIPADVVFATSTPLTIALPGAYAAFRRKVPMVFEVRDLWPEVPIALGALRNPLAIGLARRLEQFAYRNSRKIVTLAPGMADSIEETGYRKDDITIIPNGSDVELFSNGRAERVREGNPWIQGRRIVLYAGTLGYVNGAEYLPRLAAACRERGEKVCFVMAGSGKEFKQTQETARSLGVLGDNLFMLGAISKNDVADWFAAADLTVSLIRDDPVLWRNAVTNKFFDSLAAGKPIACNHPGWQTEIAEAHGAGIRLPVNPADAAAPLLEFLSSQERIAIAASRARALADERFSREILAKQLEQVLFDAAAC